MKKIETVGLQIECLDSPLQLVDQDIHERLRGGIWDVILRRGWFPLVDAYRLDFDTIQIFRPIAVKEASELLCVYELIVYYNVLYKETVARNNVLIIPALLIADGQSIAANIVLWLMTISKAISTRPPLREREDEDEIAAMAVNLTTLIRFHEGLTDWHDILRVKNAELRRRYLEKLGRAEFMRQIKETNQYFILDKDDKGNELLKIGNLVFVDLQDSSHPEYRYQLQVPPNIQTVHEARAWTFGLSPQEFQPTVET